MDEFDLSVLRFIAHHRIGVLDAVARAVMAVGTNNAVLVVAALVAIGLAVRAKRERLAALTVISTAAGFAIATALKAVIERPRPPADLSLVSVATPAMPSRHAVITAAAATALYLGCDWLDTTRRRRLGATLAAAVVAVGACMVYLGAHWLTDILVGWPIGVAIASAVVILSRRGVRSRRSPARA